MAPDPQCPTASQSSTCGGWETSHTQTGWLTSMTMSYNPCTQKWLEMCVSVSRDILLMESPAVVDSLKSLSTAGRHQDILVHLRRSVQRWTSAWMKEQISLLGRQAAGRKEPAQREKNKQSPPGESASTLQDGKRTEEETPGGGGWMEKSNQVQVNAGKPTPLFTSQYWPMLEVSECVNFCVF